MKNLLSDLLLLAAFCLLAQWATAQTANPKEAEFGKTLNESFAAFQVIDSDAYAGFFMEKAELIDASGAVIIGRNAIAEWHKGLLKNCAEADGATREMLSKRTRLLRPDLAVVVATTQVKYHGQTAQVAYNCLFRRIDSKWYVETCAIVPVEEAAKPLALSDKE